LEKQYFPNISINNLELKSPCKNTFSLFSNSNKMWLLLRSCLLHKHFHKLENCFSSLPFLQTRSFGEKRTGSSLRTSSLRNPASVFWNIST